LVGECIVRRGERKDLRDIYLIEVKSFPYPYPIEAFISFMVLFPRYFLVVDCDGMIAGYVVGARRSDGSGHIVSIAVKPSYRGRGLGRLLMNSVEAEMISDGVKRIWLEVSINNRDALKLYRNLGYRIVGIKKNYYPDGSDAYLMLKDLRN
jgi:ribosomal-protein-alanine N-acetyltransferase